MYSSADIESRVRSEDVVADVEAVEEGSEAEDVVAIRVNQQNRDPTIMDCGIIYVGFPFRLAVIETTRSLKWVLIETRRIATPFRPLPFTASPTSLDMA